MLHTKLIESFENAKSLAVARPNEGVNADYQLLVAIRAFQISPPPQLTAQVELSAKVLGREGKIISSRIVRHTAPVQALEGVLAAAALDQAFGATAVDLVSWVSGFL